MKPARSDYAIVDLRSGGAWLTSRLYIFSLILGEVSGLRAFVFLESANNIRRRFIGVATPSKVRRALGRRYPWFEEAFARTLASQYPDIPAADAPDVSTFSNQPSPFTPDEQWRVSTFVQQFVENLQRTTEPPENERSSYLEIGTPPYAWERTHWIDGERLERDLVGVLDYVFVEESPDSPRRQVTEAVIRRHASLVALVDSDRRFVGLVDRVEMLNQMARAERCQEIGRQCTSKKNRTST